MYITVLRGKMEERVFPTPNGPKVVHKEKDHYNGKILEIKALDLPYIAVICHERLGKRNEVLDLRAIEIMALTPEFILGVLPKMELHKDAFWEDVKDLSLENTDVTIEEIFKDL